MKSCWAFIQTNGVRWLKNLSVIKSPLHGHGRLRRGLCLDGLCAEAGEHDNQIGDVQPADQVADPALELALN